jgi:diguanylate cyclase (GGDEF)-like protein
LLQVVLGLLLGCGCALAAAPGAPATFDAAFRRLDDGGIATLDTGQVARQLRVLQRLVPPGDTGRELLYRALRCSWGFPDDPRAALAFAEDGLRRALRARDEAAQVRFHYCLAGYREQVATALQALADYEAGIALARKLGDDRLLAEGLAARGNVQSLLGEQGRAVLDFLAAQRRYERAGRHNDAESNLLNLAVAYRRMGDSGKALDYLRQSEAFATRIGDWNTLTVTLMQLGYLHEDQGRAEDALASYRRVLALARKQSSGYDLASAHLGMAYSYILQRQYPRALRALEQAQAEFTAVGDHSNQDMLDLRRGQAHAGLGQHAQALADYARAATVLERDGNLRYRSMLYRARAASHQALGQAEPALADLQRYIETSQALERRNRSQQTELLRHQFDAARRDLENHRLVTEQSLRERQLAALLKARRWQRAAIVLAGLLVVVLGALVARQFVRMRGLRELAATDPLTGLANRRSIERLGNDAVARARAAGEPLATLTFDVDHFKAINDGYGHLAGDQVLARLARLCQHALRQFDLLGRIGGEEFLAVLPNTPAVLALQIAERLRAVVATANLDDIAPGLKVTISIGIAELHPVDTDLQPLMRRADSAMYRAKANGRDRVEASGDAASGHGRNPADARATPAMA